MEENKVCPNCGTENKHLNLVETRGIYICSKCRKVINAVNNEIVDTDQLESTKKKTN